MHSHGHWNLYRGTILSERCGQTDQMFCDLWPAVCLSGLAAENEWLINQMGESRADIIQFECQKLFSMGGHQPFWFWHSNSHSHVPPFGILILTFSFTGVQWDSTLNHRGPIRRRRFVRHTYISIMKVIFLEILYSEKCTETMLKSSLYALKNTVQVM